MLSLDSKNSTTNPNPRTAILATYFLRSLAVIELNTRKSSSLHRSRCIRRAAYASMAKATGAGKAWSRAILRRLRAPGNQGLLIHRKVRVAKPQAREPSCDNTLRRVVPGGKGMDFCTLLEETAHFVECLSMQVGLMQTIVSLMSGQEPNYSATK